MKEVCLAMDIGGTKVALALIDREGTMHASTTQATDAAKGASVVIASMFAGANTLLTQATEMTLQVVGIGISSCGVIDPSTGAVASAAPAIPGWEGTPLGQTFRDKYKLPVFVDNDANCALVGEAWKQQGNVGAIESGTVLMMTLGTGLGGAIMVGGRLITGRHHITGHFGIAKIWDRIGNRFVPVEWFVSGTGLRNIYLQQGGTQTIAHGEAVMKLAHEGDDAAITALDCWLDHLAMQLHNFYWVIDPDLVLIGGGVIHSQKLWWPTLLAKLDALDARIQIAPASLGNDAGLFGAAKLTWNNLPAPA